MDWNNLTLEKYLKLQKIDTTLPEDDLQIEIMKIIFGDEVIDLPLNEFKEKSKELSFLNNLPEPSTNIIKHHYKINNNYYEIMLKIDEMTASQYIDYQNYAKQNDIIGMISVFLFPKGIKKYNNGYNIDDVKNDILLMPMLEVINLQNFFMKYSSAYTIIFLNYLIKKTKKDKTLTKEQKKSIIEELKKMQFSSLE